MMSNHDRDVYVGPLQRSGVVPIRCTSTNIEIFLAEVRKLLYASQGSDQRIGQILVNVVGSNMFGLEDENLIGVIRAGYISYVQKEVEDGSERAGEAGP